MWRGVRLAQKTVIQQPRHIPIRVGTTQVSSEDARLVRTVQCAARDQKNRTSHNGCRARRRRGEAVGEGVGAAEGDGVADDASGSGVTGAGLTVKGTIFATAGGA